MRNRVKRAKRFMAYLLMLTLVMNLSGVYEGFVKAAGASVSNASGDGSGNGTNISGDGSGNANASGNSTQAQATTQAPPVIGPQPVKELNVGNQTMNSIELSWEPVAGATGYILQTYNYTTKAWDALDTVLADSTVSMYTYTATDMNAGTTHRFRIFTYVGDSANVSAVVKSIKTGCKPAYTQLTAVAGDKCARLNWPAVKSTGYNIYKKTAGGDYEKISTLNAAETTYLATGLSNGTEYTFKVCAYSTFSAVDNGVSYSNTFEGDSLENKVVPGAVKNTSSSAYLFSTKDAFKKSAAYKDYAIAKKINHNKVFITPGVSITNVKGIDSANFITQGNVCAKKYYFIGAYDSTGVENSVIYVMKRSTHKYVMTLVLPNKEKITDMAFDGNNIWMTAGTNIAFVRYSTITSKISTGLDSASISYKGVYTTVKNPYYMGYYDGILWVGSYSDSKNYMEGYTIGNKTTTKPTLTYKKRMQMLSKVRAINIDSSGYLYTLRSNQKQKGTVGYVSQIRTYLPTWSTTAKTVKKNANKKKIKLPAMSSGIAFYNTYAYVQFSSVKDEECNYPTDRAWAIRLVDLR